MIRVYGKPSGWCLFVGPYRLRWQPRDFHPLPSERWGRRRWRKVGRLGWLIDR